MRTPHALVSCLMCFVGFGLLASPTPALAYQEVEAHAEAVEHEAGHGHGGHGHADIAPASAHEFDGHELDGHGHQVRQDSYLIFVIRSAGAIGMLTIFTSVVVFLVSLLVIFASRRPSVVASCLVLLPLPFLLGLFGCFAGSISSLMVIANSTSAPKPAEIAEGVSTALISMQLGILGTLPTLLLLAVGMFYRAATYNPSIERSTGA